MTRKTLNGAIDWYPGSLVSLLSSLVLIGFSLGTFGHAQTAEQLSQVRKLYIESPWQGRGAGEIRSHLVRRLQSSHRIQIVQELNKADALVRGTGQIWTTGSISLSPRSHTLSQRTFEGFSSLEVIGRNDQTLWSYLVTPSKFPWGSIADDLARQLVTRLLTSIQEGHEPDVFISDTPASAQVALKGAGATFPAPLYRKWFESFEQDHHDVQIGYEAVGSGEGIRRLKEGTVDFAASERPLSDEDVSRAPEHIIQVPMVLGAVVPIYNLPDPHQSVALSPEILAGIYLGKIKKWNDPQIRKANRGAALPDAEIVVVHRSDSSGTSFVWSDYLSKVSPVWKASVGVGVTVPWPVGVGAAYNEGVAAMVQHTPNSIGYVEFIYAVQHELQFAPVKNKAGQFIKADIASVRAAANAAGAQPDSGFRISITDAPGKTAYPIATYTWLLLPEQAGDRSKRTALLGLVRWMLTSGQKSCSALGYTPLPEDIARHALESVNR